MAHLTVHDATPELYAQLDVPEQGGHRSFWKTLTTPTLRITFFRPDGYEVPSSRPEV